MEVMVIYLMTLDLDNLNIEPAIQIRKNASTKVRECQLRRNEVLLIKKLGYERWIIPG
jgi:hypothetical protein